MFFQKVSDSSFDPPLNKFKKNCSSKSISTEDFIEHVNISEYTKNDLMSPSALDCYSANLQMDIQVDFINEKRYRKISEQKSLPNAKIITVKIYEDDCQITGIKRFTLIIPMANNQNILDTTEIDELKFRVEQYEEYQVMDRSVDTEDLSKRVRFDKFTYVQLLSDTVNLNGEEDIVKTTILIETKDAQYQSKENVSKETTDDQIKKYFLFFYSKNL